MLFRVAFDDKEAENIEVSFGDFVVEFDRLRGLDPSVEPDAAVVVKNIVEARNV